MFGGARTCDCFVHLPTNPATREPTSVTKILFAVFALTAKFSFSFLLNYYHSSRSRCNSSCLKFSLHFDISKFELV